MSQASETANQNQLLVLNSGSSSLKFALYDLTSTHETRRLWGKLTRIGLPDSRFVVSFDNYADGESGRVEPRTKTLNLPDSAAAGAWLLNWLAQQPDVRLGAVAHRLVHGGSAYKNPQCVTPALLAGLRPLVPFAPDHLPAEISLIETVQQQHQDLPQMVCFDTGFHQTMPNRAKRLPIPRHFADEGLVRYGFHGLSCEYVMRQLATNAGPAAAQGRVVVAHLGNGASMTAVRDEKSVETTMGFTPTGGLMMGTRTGDLDPGAVLYLLRNKHLDTEMLSQLLNHESGLQGVSGLSSDMQELLDNAAHCPPAANAIELFCYLAKKQLGALVAVLNGVDTLIFTGGIGENAPEIRANICAELDFFGIVLDPKRNAENEPIISPDNSRATVRVIPTNEELMIFRHARDVLLN
jgi:acetate kinase